MSPAPTRRLSPLPDLEQHKKQAKDLLKAYQSADPDALARVKEYWRRLAASRAAEGAAPFKLSDAQRIVAQEHGFASWPRFRRHIESLHLDFDAKVERFIDAACPTPESDHRSGSLAPAQDLLDQEPSLAGANIFTASLLGEAVAVERMLESDPSLAVLRGGLRNWDPLLYLTFSRFLRLQPERLDGFVRTAQLLLKHGADPDNFFMCGHEKETALYGAAGVAHSPALTQVLLEAGANPNDGEVAYHGAVARDITCLSLVFERGLDRNHRATALLRKPDFDDLEGVRLLLEAGGDPNGGLEEWGKTALHQAVLRGRGRRFIDLLIKHGANINGKNSADKSPYALACRLGRTEVAEELVRHGADPSLSPVDEMLAACMRADKDTVQDLRNKNPGLVDSLSAEDQAVIVDAAGAGNTDVVRLMLDVGFDITGGAGSYQTPLHAAALQGRTAVVALLIERNAPIEMIDSVHHQTPLDWAIYGAGGKGDHAGVVERLLEAGVEFDVARIPTGHDAIDDILRRRLAEKQTSSTG